MAIVAQKSFTDGSNNTYYTSISDSYFCDANEEYKTDFQQDFSGASFPAYWGGTKTITYTLRKYPNYNDRCALWLDTDPTHIYMVIDDTYNTAVFDYVQTWDGNPDSSGSNSGWVYSAFAYSDVRDGQYALMGSTNMPIFETKADANAYLTAITQADALNALKKAINYKDSQIEPEHGDVFINNWGVLQKWTIDGQEEVQSTTLIYRTFRMKVTNGKISFYKIEGIDGDSLKAGVKYSNDFNALSIGYSEDGGRTYTYVDHLPYDFIYRTRENELGEFYACPVDLLSLDTNIPLWENENDADDYNDGNKDITDAVNWGSISDKYPIANGTGDGDEETEFGLVRAKNFFSQTYICSSSAIQEISNALFDTDATGITHLWEKIKEGVAMYGQDPMQVVQGLMFFPVVLSEVFTEWASQQYVYFGGYKLDLQSGVKKLNFPNGYKSIGHITIKKTFNNWRDYEPFSKLFVYLPYVGTYQLSLERYYNKDTEVRYYIDIRTGGCVACLIADGLLMDYFNGQMGVQMPITLTDKNNYANSQIQTLLGGVQREGNTLTGAMNVGGMSNAYVATAVGTAGTMLNAYRTTYELSQNNINNFNKTRGGSTSMLNEYLPQYVTFMFEIQQDDPTANHDMLIGQPTNASGNLGDFSGYLEVETVNLNCGIATQNEKNKILSMLHNGIYI